eukprot:4652895-Pyramimonas_sp.AAC.1
MHTVLLTHGETSNLPRCGGHWIAARFATVPLPLLYFLLFRYCFASRRPFRAVVAQEHDALGDEVSVGVLLLVAGVVADAVLGHALARLVLQIRTALPTPQPFVLASNPSQLPLTASLPNHRRKPTDSLSWGIQSHQGM